MTLLAASSTQPKYASIAYDLALEGKSPDGNIWSGWAAYGELAKPLMQHAKLEVPALEREEAAALIIGLHRNRELVGREFVARRLQGRRSDGRPQRSTTMLSSDTSSHRMATPDASGTKSHHTSSDAAGRALHSMTRPSLDVPDRVLAEDVRETGPDRRRSDGPSARQPLVSFVWMQRSGRTAEL